MNERRTTTLIPTILMLAAGLAATCGAVELRDVPQGFTSLVRGVDLAGWKGGETVDPAKITAQQQAKWDAELSDHWRVADGELVSDGQGPFLSTKQDYGDFELWVDWKLAPGSDSGIYLRGCPQVQLWDPKYEPDHKHGSDKGSGGLWNNQRGQRWPSEVADKPAGDWNRMYVRIVGEYVTVILNDKKVVDDVVLENYYDRKKPIPMRGPIQLQTHGKEARFSNLFVREIPADEANRLLAETRGGDDGFKSLLNGKDLAGWVGAVDDYEVADGGVRVKAGRGGNLLTADEYSNFAVRLEFKLPAGGNNGLAIRSPDPKVDAAYEAVELQVLDDRDPKYAQLHEYQFCGSAYGLAPAHRGYLRPLDQWNYEEVVVDGDHVEVRLNGFKTLDVHLNEVAKRPVDGNAHPGASRTRGRFGFCGHNDPVAYRHVRIKPLAD